MKHDRTRKWSRLKFMTRCSCQRSGLRLRFPVHCPDTSRCIVHSARCTVSWVRWHTRRIDPADSSGPNVWFSHCAAVEGSECECESRKKNPNDLRYRPTHSPSAAACCKSDTSTCPGVKVPAPPDCGAPPLALSLLLPALNQINRWHHLPTGASLVWVLFRWHMYRPDDGHGSSSQSSFLLLLLRLQFHLLFCPLPAKLYRFAYLLLHLLAPRIPWIPRFPSPQHDPGEME